MYLLVTAYPYIIYHIRLRRKRKKEEAFIKASSRFLFFGPTCFYRFLNLGKLRMDFVVANRRGT